MILSEEEKMMYKVMKAIFESGIPVIFKGSMVLRTYLVESGYMEEIRHTLDVDGNWFSESPPSVKDMSEVLQNVLETNGIPLNVTAYRSYAVGRSAGFELIDKKTGDPIFSMDIDVSLPFAMTRVYDIEGIRFIGVSPSRMIADKIYVVSTDKVFRRIKDVIDLYYLSSVIKINKNEIDQALSDSGRILNDFNGFLNRIDELRHSYEKFRFSSDVRKPPFDQVYENVKGFVAEFIPIIDK